jgi:hypothetical protein
MSAYIVCGVFVVISLVERVGVGGVVVVLPGGPRPLQPQYQGGAPVLVSCKTSRQLQQPCTTAGGGEDHVCHSGGSDCSSCASGC